ncbi:hypothetical protein METH_16535 [Leisingera methylohalidivorans DSM 14336]|uniref:Uncharacterized protein n=1 Tax=Leisingera methylohalidivorans DSM 14336 TaxID=999552 RepID=V9VZ37_9RHOB|nr:hypothetical protein METH_16535 [Leisingera methylohalidivorans DSM 14336]
MVRNSHAGGAAGSENRKISRVQRGIPLRPGGAAPGFSGSGMENGQSMLLFLRKTRQVVCGFRCAALIWAADTAVGQQANGR